MQRIRNFIRDESAATSIEYALIAAGIACVIIGTVNSLGSQLKTTFSNINNALKNAGK